MNEEVFIYLVDGQNCDGSYPLSAFDSFDKAIDEINRLNDMQKKVWSDYGWMKIKMNEPYSGADIGWDKRDWLAIVKHQFQNAQVELPETDALIEWFKSGCSPHDVLANCL